MDRDAFRLSDEQFARLKPHLPSDTRGKPRVNDRGEYQNCVAKLEQIKTLTH
jgi:hypothetical protein